MIQKLSERERAAGLLLGIGAIQLAPGRENGFPASGEEIAQGDQLFARCQRHKGLKGAIKTSALFHNLGDYAAASRPSQCARSEIRPRQTPSVRSFSIASFRLRLLNPSRRRKRRCRRWETARPWARRTFSGEGWERAFFAGATMKAFFSCAYFLASAWQLWFRSNSASSQVFKWFARVLPASGQPVKLFLLPDELMRFGRIRLVYYFALAC